VEFPETFLPACLALFAGNYQFLPSKSVKKGEYSPVECTVYTDFDFQNALFPGKWAN
jgi:hypothetical protein